ncbi:DUF4124 domain-containing protein [Fulvimonas yonginensis]|uniref:DUF4124 domain-containing protein n=1 Tax=Fulvimonas yonginensis TaxID=1495200 RepID=A0ABU8JBL8_9GAMM
MLLLGVLLACSAAAASAQDTYYKWTDASGTVHFSATPPAGQRAEAVKVGGTGAARVAPGQPPAAAGSAQQFEQATAAYRRQSCEAARNDLKVLSQGRMVVSGDSPDVATKLDAEQREQARLRAQQRVSQFCDNGGKP